MKALWSTYPVMITVLVICLLAGVIYPGWWLLNHRAMDLPSYYIAAILTLEGKNPYHPVELGLKAHQLALDNPIYPYIYFPLIALMFLPLATLPYPVVQIIWFFIVQLFIWSTVVVTFLLFTRDDVTRNYDPRTVKLITTAILIVSYPLIVDIRNGQVNSMVVFLFAAFVYMLFSGKDVFSGIALGIMCMIKPQPMILIPYLLFVRKIRCGVTGLITIIFGTATTATVIGWKNFFYYLQEVLPTFNMIKTSFPPIPIFVPANQSIQGFVNRFFETTLYTRAYFNFPGLVKPVSMLFVLLLLALTAVAIWRSNGSVATVPNQVILKQSLLLMVTSVLISPITWDHHLIVVAVAVAYLFLCEPDFMLTRWKGRFLLVSWLLLMAPLLPNGVFAECSVNLSFLMSFKTFALSGIWFLIYDNSRR